MTEKCVAVCRDCTTLIDAPAVQPFSSWESHDAWVVTHGTSTGHQVRSVQGWPAPDVAYRSAFGEGEKR